MSGKTLFAVVFLAVFLASLAAAGYQDYSKSHILVVFRRIEGSDAFQVFSLVTPFHRARGFLYMVPLYREYRECFPGMFCWDQEYGASDNFQAGVDFIGLTQGDEDSRLQYVLVCSGKGLRTAEEIWAASRERRWDNSVYFDPYDYLPRTAVLQCWLP